MLKWSKRIIQIIWYFLMILIGVAIAMYNPEPVTVKFLMNMNIENISLGTVLCMTLLLGGFLGFATAQVSVWRQKRKTRKAEKEVSKLKKMEDLANSEKPANKVNAELIETSEGVNHSSSMPASSLGTNHALESR